MHTEIFYTNKNIKDFKIAIISDIHYYPEYNLNTFKTIINQIKKNKPDYITIVGDILDNSTTKELANLKDFITTLSQIAPTIVVIGNHDEKKGAMHDWTFYKNMDLIKMLNNINNVHLLQDSKYTINNITFYGFNPSYKYYEEDYETYESFCNEINKLNPMLNNENYNITLCHTPINIYNYLKQNKEHNLNNSDLILSGHMHNGCLPFIISYPINKLFHSTRGIMSPNRTLFPKYAQGRVYERDGYIYEGITKLSHSTKLFHKFDFLFKKRVEFLIIKHK